MGTKERRLAEKERLRDAILSEARALCQQGSWNDVTMRKLAAAIQYSLPTIYEYFESKDDLLKALQHEGYGTLCAMLTKNLHSITKPMEVLTVVAQTYWDFAKQNPELYNLMHNQKNVRADHEETIAFIRSTVKEALKKVLSHNKSKISQQELDNKTDMTRGIMHGFIMLSLVSGMEKTHAHALMMQALAASIKY